MNQMKDCEILQYDVLDPTCKSFSWYYVGYWGDVKVAVVQTSMGTGGLGGSWYETRKAMHLSQTYAIPSWLACVVEGFTKCHWVMW